MNTVRDQYNVWIYCLLQYKTTGECLTNICLPALFLTAMLSLAGICVYMAYSAAAFKEAVDISGHKTLEDIEIYFGWSLILASVSFVGELCTAVAFLLSSARVSQLTNQEEHEYWHGLNQDCSKDRRGLHPMKALKMPHKHWKLNHCLHIYILKLKMIMNISGHFSVQFP